MRRALALVLAALPVFLASCRTNTAPETVTSGVEGRVLAGPACPVEYSNSPCPDRPLATEITVVRASSGAFVKRGQSGEDGGFRISLAPGRYIVSANATSGVGGSQPVTVVVEDGKYSSIEIHVDTGIR